MNLEDRLSEALHSDLDSRRPSPELADQIAQALRDHPLPARRWPSFRPAARSRLAAGIVAVSLLAVLAPVALFWAPGPFAGPRDMTPTPAPSALTHFTGGGLAFDYPASWRNLTPGPRVSNGTFLGSGSVSGSCVHVTPYANDDPIRPITEYCGIDLRLEPGQVVVELATSQGLRIAQENYGSSNTFVTVGGLPAIRHKDGDASDGTTSMAWTLSVSQDPGSCYQLRATMKGPGLEDLKAQVLALVASIEYDPPVPVLDPKDGPQAAARALEELRTGGSPVSSDGSGYECFDAVPGATATATITQLFSRTLREPWPVTCSMAIEPHILGLWKMTLTRSWAADADRPAGMATETVWLKPNGEIVGIEGMAAGMPYLP